MKGEVLAHFEGDFFATVFDVEYNGDIVEVVGVEEVGVLPSLLSG